MNQGMGRDRLPAVAMCCCRFLTAALALLVPDDVLYYTPEVVAQFLGPSSLIRFSKWGNL